MGKLSRVECHAIEARYQVINMNKMLYPPYADVNEILMLLLTHIQKVLGDQFAALIEQAVASQYARHSEFLNETLDFIRFTRHEVPEFEKLPGNISR
jgi:hypothetical protein